MRSETRIHDLRPTPGRTKPRAGGAVGDATRDRLRRLIAARGESQAAFARACRVEAPRVTEWLSGAQLPSAEHMRAIADGTRVSLDWLLLGDGGDEPRYRGQSKTQPELEADLAAAVARGIGAPTLPADLYGNEWARAGALLFGYCPDIDAAGILRDAVERARAGRDRLLERCCDVVRLIGAGWPLVVERWGALKASCSELEVLASEAAALADDVLPIVRELRAEYGDHMPVAEAIIELNRRDPVLGARVGRLEARWRALPIAADAMCHTRAFVWQRFKAFFAAFRRKEGHVGLPTAATVTANRHALWPALQALAAEVEAREKAQSTASYLLPTARTEPKRRGAASI